MIKSYPVRSFTVGCDFCGKELSNIVVLQYWADQKALVLRKYLKQKYSWVMSTWGEKDSKMYCSDCAITHDMVFKFIV